MVKIIKGKNNELKAVSITSDSMGVKIRRASGLSEKSIKFLERTGQYIGSGRLFTPKKKENR